MAGARRKLSVWPTDRLTGGTTGGFFSNSDGTMATAIISTTARRTRRSISKGFRKDYGTGSNPPGLNGWQRTIRRAPSHPPRSTPYLSIASRVYCEQLGIKRQLGGSPGEMKRWYPRIRRMAARRGQREIGCTGSPEARAPRQQLALERREARSIRLASRADDYVPRRHARHQLPAPDFPQPSPQTVAGHRGGLKLRNDQSHPGVARLIVCP